MTMRCVVVAALLSVASADVYMQNPRGSNNKLNEVSNNVNNANRLFDSQYVVQSSLADWTVCVTTLTS